MKNKSLRRAFAAAAVFSLLAISFSDSVSAVSAANNQTNDTNDKISLISSIIGSDYDASKVAISSNDNILTQNVSTIQYDPYQNTTVIVYGTDGTVKTIISDGNAGSVIAGMDAITTLASQTTTDAGVTGQSGNSGVTTTSASQAKTTKKTTSTIKTSTTKKTTKKTTKTTTTTRTTTTTTTTTAPRPIQVAITLYESYNSDYQIYSESMNGLFYFYSNVANNGITDGPVYLDIPDNISYTVEKNGKKISYASNNKISADGNYVFRLSAITDLDRPVSERTQYSATFNFRIQEKPTTVTQAEETVYTDSYSDGGWISDGSADGDLTGGDGSLPDWATTLAGDGSSESVTDNGGTEGITSTVQTITTIPIDDITAQTVTAADLTTVSPVSDAESSQVINYSCNYSQDYDTATGLYVIKFDKVHSMTANLPDGMISNTGVTVDFTGLGSGYTFKILKNGVEYSMPDNSQFTEVGKYDIFLTLPDATYTEGSDTVSDSNSLDDLMNITEGNGETDTQPQVSQVAGGNYIFSFRIIGSEAVNMSNYTIPKCMTLSSFTKNTVEDGSVDADTFDEKSGLVSFDSDAAYVMSLTNAAGVISNISLTIDTAAPYFEVSVSKHTATLKYASGDVASILVTCNGNTDAYTMVNTLTDPGDYVVRVYDQAGNYSEQTFTLTKKLNMAGVFAVLILVALLTAGIMYYRKTKNNFNVK